MKTCGSSRSSGLAPFRGFTLIELLVAAAITVLIAGVAGGVVSSALQHWNRLHGALTTESRAREVLDRMTQDLQGALFRNDGNLWLAATVQSTTSASGAWVDGPKPAIASLDPAAVRLADARFGVAGVWLRFFTTAQGADVRTTDPPAPVAVSYQIIRRPPTPTSLTPHYMLYRTGVTPSATFEAGYDLGAASYTNGSEVDGSPGNVVSPGFRQLLADHVIDFGVRFYGYAPDPVTGAPRLQPTFPLDAADLEYRAQSSLRADLRGRLPAVVDVMLRILTEEGARQLGALEAGQIAGDWWTIAAANSRTFVRRVILRADPL